MHANTPAHDDALNKVAQLEARVKDLEVQLAAARGQTITLDAKGTTLVQRKALFAADMGGFFSVPAWLERFSLDVGHNEGKVMVADWLPRRSDMFAIGIEANPHLVALFESIVTNGRWPADFEGRWWHVNDAEYAVDNARAYRRARQRGQLLLIHAAVSNAYAGVVPFNPGFGWRKDVLVPDVGSLLEWQHASRKKAASPHFVPVASLRLDEVLARVPPRLWFDTLKVDIQGADADALISAGRYLERFACVVGEFRANHYDVPSGVVVDPKEVLERSGFHKIAESMREKVWVNRRFLARFDAPGNYTCTAGEAVPGAKANRTAADARAEDAARHEKVVAAVRCVRDRLEGSATSVGGHRRCEWRGGWLMPSRKQPGVG